MKNLTCFAVSFGGSFVQGFSCPLDAWLFGSSRSFFRSGGSFSVFGRVSSSASFRLCGVFSPALPSVASFPAGVGFPFSRAFGRAFVS